MKEKLSSNCRSSISRSRGQELPPHAGIKKEGIIDNQIETHRIEIIEIAGIIIIIMGILIITTAALVEVAIIYENYLRNWIKLTNSKLKMAVVLIV